MKLTKTTHSNNPYLTAKQLKVNCLYEIVCSPVNNHNGKVVVKIKDKIYEINDFSDCWDSNYSSFMFREFNPGESITLTQE